MEGDLSALAPLRFDTALLPPPSRFEAWRAALTNFDLSRTGDDPFAAVASVWLLEPLILTHATVDPLRYDRDRARLAQDANDHFAMVYLVSGGFVGDYGAGTVASGPGSLTVLDMRRPCWTEADRLEAYILSMPRAFMMSALGGIEPHGMVATQGCAPLLGDMLRAIVARLPTLTRDHAQTLAGIVRDLVARTLVDADRTMATRRPRDDALVTRVRAHIDAHIADELDTASICTAVGVSRSALYRAFERAGGVQQQVQRRRLQIMRGTLADPGDTRSIGEIAAALGFADKSHASRLFKREFGCTPGQYRDARNGDALASLPVGEAPRVFESWTTLLD